jgi:hypothetical protein
MPGTLWSPRLHIVSYCLKMIRPGLVLGCEVQSVEASGVVNMNDDLLPDFGAIARPKIIVYSAIALRQLLNCLRACLAVRTLVQHSHDCGLTWREVEPLTLEGDDSVIIRVL